MRPLVPRKPSDYQLPETEEPLGDEEAGDAPGAHDERICKKCL